LPKLFNTVIVPPAVIAELTKGLALDEARMHLERGSLTDIAAHSARVVAMIAGTQIPPKLRQEIRAPIDGLNLFIISQWSCLCLIASIIGIIVGDHALKVFFAMVIAIILTLWLLIFRYWNLRVTAFITGACKKGEIVEKYHTSRNVSALVINSEEFRYKVYVSNSRWESSLIGQLVDIRVMVFWNCQIIVLGA
jgi:hypothetical protein